MLEQYGGLFGPSRRVDKSGLPAYESERKYDQVVEIGGVKFALEYQVVKMKGVNVIDAKILVFNGEPKYSNYLAAKVIRFRKIPGRWLQRGFWEGEISANLEPMDERLRFLIVRLFITEMKDLAVTVTNDLLANELAGEQIKRIR